MQTHTLIMQLGLGQNVLVFKIDLQRPDIFYSYKDGCPTI